MKTKEDFIQLITTRYPDNSLPEAALLFEVNLAKSIAPANSYSITDEKLASYFLICDYCLTTYVQELGIALNSSRWTTKLSNVELTLEQVLALTRLIVDIKLDRSVRKTWINNYCTVWRPELWKLVKQKMTP